MHVAILGTYPPTRCGIATFTADVETSLRDLGLRVTVVPVDPTDEPPAPGNIALAQQPSSVASPVITSDDPQSYENAASWLNGSDVDVVLIQHEFGIHGGEDGSSLLRFTDALTLPYVVTLHTVLPHFSASRSTVLQELCARACAVTVFTATARRMVLEQELASARSLRVVPHGAPMEMYRALSPAEARRRLHLPEHGPVLSTFGLLSAGKGLELAIRALPPLVERWPDLRYVIAGRTHPGVLRHEGEQYREGLQQLAEQLGVRGHVVFVDRFLGIEEIAEVLAATDVFCTPYRNENQIVSGALTFALAAGCPVVSTPYRYADDMLAGGAGIVVPQDDATAFSDALHTILTDDEQRRAALAAAQHVAGTLSWPSVARTLERVLAEALEEPAAPPRPTVDHFTVAALGRTHLRILCDDSAMLQHAELGVPRLEEGYCVDDAARLLPLASRWARDAPDGEHWRTVVTRMLAFLRSAALGAGGQMRNFMSWDRRWLDEPHDGDHVGRAVWGLGELIHDETNVEEAIDLLALIGPRASATAFSHNLAYTALGVIAADSRDPALAENLGLIEASLSAMKVPRDGAWQWPEQRLTYDSARLAEAMMRVGVRTHNQRLVDDGVVMFRWFERLCSAKGYYRFPGHLGVHPGGDVRNSGDEQPLEAASMADAALEYHNVTGDPAALLMVERAWSWFLGNNRLRRHLGNLESGACCDALCETDVNRNCGAESTISFHRCAATWAAALQRPATVRNGLVVAAA